MQASNQPNAVLYRAQPSERCPRTACHHRTRSFVGAPPQEAHGEANPAVALPCGLDEHGTPFGIQIVGPAYDDRRLLSIAHALEGALAEDPVTVRPTPDIATLESTVSSCRELGRTV